jgi:DNA-binding transcriptional regulator YdaS (Cro superfamily)
LSELHVKTLKRAAEIVGGEQQLALKLRVTPSHLALWLEGIATPPGDVFLRAVDLVTDDELFRLAAPRPVTMEKPL